MTYKSILVHAEQHEACEPRLKCAGAIADLFGSVLIGLGAEMMQSAGVADPFGMLAMDWEGLLRKQLEEDLARAEARFRAAAGDRVQEWRVLEALPTDAICWCARGADLIIAGGGPRKGADAFRTADPTELALRSGRPVLIAPPTLQPFRGDHVVVAWKDTREARRGLLDALPFLLRAQSVTVLEICDERKQAAAEFRTADVAAHLRRHGAKASSRVKIAEEGVAGWELRVQAQSLDADLIVAGCYGHHRLQEWVTGGVTRDLVGEASGFLLLSH